MQISTECPSCGSANWNGSKKGSTPGALTIQTQYASNPPKYKCEDCGKFFEVGSEKSITQKSKAPTITSDILKIGMVEGENLFYPRDEAVSAIEALQPYIKGNSVLGEFNPEYTESIADHELAAVRVSKLWLEDDLIMCTLDVLDTPRGEILKTYLREGGKIQVAPRSIGSIDPDDEGEDHMVRDYAIITVDIFSIKD